MKNVKRDFQISAIASSYYFRWNSDFSFQGESHRMWEMVFLQSGNVEVTEDEMIYTLKKNDMIIHAPWEFHRIRSADGTSPVVWVISFYVDGTLPESLKKGIFSLSVEQSLVYSRLCERISAFFNAEAPSAYAGQEVADSLSAFLIQLSEEAVSSDSDLSRAASEYKKLVVAMTSGVCDNKSLADFAKEANVSISYMKLLFKEYAGISPKAYYTELRIRYAAEMLDKGVTVSEVAEKMNFSSANYFSTFFKKHTGYMPTAYKSRNGALAKNK